MAMQTFRVTTRSGSVYHVEYHHGFLQKPQWMFFDPSGRIAGQHHIHALYNRKTGKIIGFWELDPSRVREQLVGCNIAFGNNLPSMETIGKINPKMFVTDLYTHTSEVQRVE